MKRALIKGITGQDGFYLTKLLLEKGYVLHGVKCRSSSFNTQRIYHVNQDQHDNNVNFKLHQGDLTDSTNIIRIIQEVQPNEIYNLGAMQHVKVYFDSPEYVANVDCIGKLRILEAVRILGLENKTRIYQASTSELYGEMSKNKNDNANDPENNAAQLNMAFKSTADLYNMLNAIGTWSRSAYPILELGKELPKMPADL